MAGELDPCFEDILLENVNHCPNEETVAGMAIKLYYIPAPHIATFTKPVTTGSYEALATIPPTGLVPVTGKGWKKIDCQVDKNILQNMTAGSVGNLKLKSELDIVFPGFKKKLVGFQKAHRNTPMIFGMPDSEGQMWIIGNPDSPSNFTSMVLTSGDTGEADSNLTSKINAKTSILAYDGDLTILPDTP